MTRYEAIHILKKHKLPLNIKTAATDWLVTAAEWYEARDRRRAQDRRRSPAYSGVDR